MMNCLHNTTHIHFLVIIFSIKFNLLFNSIKNNSLNDE